MQSVISALRSTCACRVTAAKILREMPPPTLRDATPSEMTALLRALPADAQPYGPLLHRIHHSASLLDYRQAVDIFDAMATLWPEELRTDIPSRCESLAPYFSGSDIVLALRAAVRLRRTVTTAAKMCDSLVNACTQRLLALGSSLCAADLCNVLSEIGRFYSAETLPRKVDIGLSSLILRKVDLLTYTEACRVFVVTLDLSLAKRSSHESVDHDALVRALTARVAKPPTTSGGVAVLVHVEDVLTHESLPANIRENLVTRVVIPAITRTMKNKEVMALNAMVKTLQRNGERHQELVKHIVRTCVSRKRALPLSTLEYCAMNHDTGDTKVIVAYAETVLRESQPSLEQLSKVATVLNTCQELNDTNATLLTELASSQNNEILTSDQCVFLGRLLHLLYHSGHISSRRVGLIVGANVHGVIRAMTAPVLCDILEGLAFSSGHIGCDEFVAATLEKVWRCRDDLRMSEWEAVLHFGIVFGTASHMMLFESAQRRVQGGGVVAPQPEVHCQYKIGSLEHTAATFLSAPPHLLTELQPLIRSDLAGLVLGLTGQWKPEDVKAKFRTLVVVAHPDSRPHDSAAADRFRLLYSAYKIALQQ